MQLTFKDRILNLDTPKIMGILNVTPDSFSDGGKYYLKEKALRQALTMVEEGADIIDVGGESTRPFSQAVSFEEECERIMEVIEIIHQECDVIISCDTKKPEVMAEAYSCGASLWNDIMGLTEEGGLLMAKKLDIPVVLMHMQGDPQSMQKAPHYKNVVQEVLSYLENLVHRALNAGIRKEHLIVDVGFGFGKTTSHNYTLLQHFDKFTSLGLPLLGALSRKSMLGAATSEPDPKKRTLASVCAAMILLQKGANLLRVHDVKETKTAIEIFNACTETTRCSTLS